MPIMILENGLGAEETLFSKKKIHDSYRIDYLRKHLSQLQLSIQEGVNVIGYFYWSPIDIVSSGSGQMHKRYGLIYVDLNDFGIGSGKRIKKDSFYWYKQYIE
jgi:6-phospho-beta-glucosidase